MNRDEIDKTALAKFGQSVFDYPGADTDAPPLIRALICMGEHIERNRKGEGFGYVVNGSTAEFIAAAAAEQIIFERLEKRALMDRIKALEAEIANLRSLGH